MDINLKAIQVRCEKATPGPWISKINYGTRCIYHSGEEKNAKNFICEMENVDGTETRDYDDVKANSDFIAHSREDIADLLKLVEKLQNQVNKLQMTQKTSKQEIVVTRMAFSVEETRQMIGVSKGSINKLLTSGEIKSIQIGKKRLIPEWAIDEFLGNKKTAHCE